MPELPNNTRSGQIDDEAGIISTAVACQLLMLSRQRLDQLAAQGWVTRHSPGRWRTVALVQGYIRFMRDEGRRMSRSAAGSRVREARAKEIEVRTAERLGKLVPLEDFDAFVDLVCGLFRAELGGLPARFTRDLPTRRALEREINELLTRIADVLDAKSAAIPGPCDP